MLGFLFGITNASHSSTASSLPNIPNLSLSDLNLEEFDFLRIETMLPVLELKEVVEFIDELILLTAFELCVFGRRTLSGMLGRLPIVLSSSSCFDISTNGKLHLRTGAEIGLVSFLHDLALPSELNFGLAFSFGSVPFTNGRLVLRAVSDSFLLVKKSLPVNNELNFDLMSFEFCSSTNGKLLLRADEGAGSSLLLEKTALSVKLLISAILCSLSSFSAAG
jgi:hypothetical protein